MFYIGRKMVKCDKGAVLRVQDFCVRRTCLRALHGCRVYNGSMATKETLDEQIRGHLRK